jgi:hypothetical protein
MVAAAAGFYFPWAPHHLLLMYSLATLDNYRTCFSIWNDDDLPRGRRCCSSRRSISGQQHIYKRSLAPLLLFCAVILCHLRAAAVGLTRTAVVFMPRMRIYIYSLPIFNNRSRFKWRLLKFGKWRPRALIIVWHQNEAHHDV